MNGFYSHLAELQHLISKINPLYICIQETRFKSTQTVNLRNHNVYRKDRNNPRNASGGVAIIVQNHLLTDEIPLTTELEAIAVSTHVPNVGKITICNF